MKEITRPIEHTWTNDEIRQEYEKCMNKKKLGVKWRDCTLGYKLTKNNFITNSNKSGLNPGKTLSETECQNYKNRAEKN